MQQITKTETTHDRTEATVCYGPENCELVRPTAVDLGDLVLHLFGEDWHLCRVVSRSSGTSGIDLKIVSISDPSKQSSSYYPFREDSTLTRVSFR